MPDKSSEEVKAEPTEELKKAAKEAVVKVKDVKPEDLGEGKDLSELDEGEDDLDLDEGDYEELDKLKATENSENPTKSPYDKEVTAAKTPEQTNVTTVPE